MSWYKCTQFATDDQVRSGEKVYQCDWSMNYTDDCLEILWYETPDDCPHELDNRLKALETSE